MVLLKAIRWFNPTYKVLDRPIKNISLWVYTGLAGIAILGILIGFVLVAEYPIAGPGILTVFLFLYIFPLGMINTKVEKILLRMIANDSACMYVTELVNGHFDLEAEKINILNKSSFIAFKLIRRKLYAEFSTPEEAMIYALQS